MPTPRIANLDAFKEKDRQREEEKKKEKELKKLKPKVNHIKKGSAAPNALEEGVKMERIAFWLDGMRQSKPMDVLTKEFVEQHCPYSKNPVTLANNYKREAMKYLEENLVKSADKFRAVQMDRLEDLYRRCLDRENFKVAKDIIDTMNKLMGMYKQDQIMIQPVTHFSFGDEQLTNFSIPQLVVPEDYVPEPEPVEDDEEEFEEAEDAVKYLTDGEEEEDVGF